MELLTGLIGGLSSPWDKKNKSLLVNDPGSPLTWGGDFHDVAYAQILDIDDGTRGALGWVQPFVGLDLYKPDFEIVFQGHPSNRLFQVGTWIGFSDFWVDEVRDGQIVLTFNNDSQIWPIPEFNKDFPVNFLHMFCGGFNGWERASKWMEINKLFIVQREIAVDFNEQAMQIWQLRTNGCLFHGKCGSYIEAHQKYIGVTAACSQKYWLNLCRFITNGFFTCSPPCPSWSRGGRGQGLECDNGVAFAECIAKIRALRPIAAFFECADKIISHPHFRILRMSLQAAGYRQCWSNVVPYENLAHMCRTRWLAVWIRADVTDVQALGSFKLADVHRAEWSSSMYDFPVPSQIQHQLKLGNELCKIYGDPCLLPPSKKNKGVLCSTADVLQARCIKQNEALPTLCAMYSQQHLIDANHLQQKGIFAALHYVDGSFQFFSPLLLASLLGAVVTEPVFLPVKIAPAFLHIGNAISVPHAVLTLAVGFFALRFTELSVTQVVSRAWADRLTVSNTIVFRSRDFVVMCPLQCIRFVLPSHNMCCLASKTNWVVTIEDVRLQVSIDENTTILHILKQIGCESNALKNVMCSAEGKAIPWNIRAREICGIPLSLTKGDSKFLAFCIEASIEASECDSLDCAILAEITRIEQHADEKPHPILPCFDTTQDEAPECKRLCIRGLLPEVKTMRVSLFVHQGIPLATDELDWIISVCAPKQLIQMQKIVGSDWKSIEHAIAEIVHSCSNNSYVKCMILFDNHWFALEIRKSQHIEFFCINSPKKLRSELFLLFESFKGVNGFKGTCGFSESSFDHGFCGWELIINWFGIVFPQFDSCALEISEFIKANGQIAGTKPEEIRLLKLWEIVCSARFHFLQTLSPSHRIEGIKIGLANDDQVMSDPANQEKPKTEDPWLQPNEDPWNQAKKSCKWEDLRLPEDHHFKNSKGKQVVQLHRHQITANNSGIAFATKSCVVDIFGISPPKCTALLLPNTEKLSFPQMPNLSITGPFEIVVRDQGLNSIYKRQVLLVQTDNEVHFQLPKANYAATTTEFKELVIEIDERLISKELSSAILAKPLETLKTKLLEQIPPLASKNIGVFGFRIVKMQSNKDSHRVFQAVCKIQADQRTTCLERSGAGDVFIRDFIPKGDSIEDLTIVPRFWQTDKISKDEALRMSSSIPGFAGLVHTRRGIAVRAWCKKVASIRQIILAHDDRISDLNQSVIPRVIRDSTGWPSIIGPQEIVRATVHAVSLPPIPTRCYKAQGVTTWTLAFDSTPKIDKFMVQINDKTYEIILTIPNEKQSAVPKTRFVKTAKGGGKGKKDPVDDAPSSIADDANSQRITSLEAKFSAMERRQDTLECKINDGFSSVNDQLRQVPNAIQPRGANNQTGMTPPPKVQKSAWWLSLGCPFVFADDAIQHGVHFLSSVDLIVWCLMKGSLLFIWGVLICFVTAICIFLKIGVSPCP